MTPKYELLQHPYTRGSETIYQIKALRDFSDVKAGDLGGYISTEENLSHDGDCWLYQQSVACEKSKVKDDAKLYGTSTLFDYAVAYNNAILKDDAELSDCARIGGDAIAKDNCLLHDHIVVTDQSVIRGNADLSGEIFVSGHSDISGDVELFDNERLHNAHISSDEQVLFIASHFGQFTFYQNNKGELQLSVGRLNEPVDDQLVAKIMAKTTEFDPTTMITFAKATVKLQ